MTDQLKKFMEEALTSYSDGNLDLAEENFKKVISLDQENYQSIYNLGIIEVKDLNKLIEWKDN